jgi:hypothetical protein
MKVPQLSDGQLEINSSYAAISKDKIITVYLASDEFEE